MPESSGVLSAESGGQMTAAPAKEELRRTFRLDMVYLNKGAADCIDAPLQWQWSLGDQR